MSNDLVSYDEQWASEAKQEASKAKLTSGGRFISHRGGAFMVGDDLEFPELCVVVLASVHENVYYGRAYDPDHITPPKCFAFGDTESDMAPHEATGEDEWFEPQHTDCRSCPHNAWPTKGEVKRKECRNMRRLLVLPVGQYAKRKGSRDLDLDLFLGDNDAENIEYVQGGDVYLMKIPPTALRSYKELVHKLQSEYNRPPHGMILRMYIEPMRTGGHTIKYEPLGTLPDALYPAIKARRAAEYDLLTKAYTPPQDEDVPF